MMFLYLLLGVLFLISAWFVPRIVRRPKPSQKIILEAQSFPEGFLWASGEDAYQHEGGNIHSDWHRWEQELRPFKDGSVSGRCADFYERWEDDFQLAASDGHNAHRIGLEWARMEPQAGERDPEAWDRYERMLQSMKDKGFSVFVNLWHFTLPHWAAELGGWESEEVMARWKEHVSEVGRRYGKYVDWWSTMIDAQIYALRGYVLGEIPPMVKDQGRALRVFCRLLDAHAHAYHLLKEVCGPQTKVGMIWFFSLMRGAGNPLDSLVFHQLDDLFNWAMLDAMQTGRFDFSILMGASISEENERWKGTLDWLGINYYYREILSFSPLVPGLVKRGFGPGRARSDMGWELYPEGLYHLGHSLARRYPGMPLIVTESGMADKADSLRPRYLAETIAWTYRLVQDAVPLLGYTCWAMTDNLEWTDGFEPKFGLYRVDRETMRRDETKSAALFRFVAKHNRLPDEDEFNHLVGQGTP